MLDISAILTVMLFVWAALIVVGFHRYVISDGRYARKAKLE